MASVCSITVNSGNLTFLFKTEDIGHANYHVKIDLLRESRSHLALLTPTFPTKQISEDWIQGTLTLIVVSNDPASDSTNAIIEFKGQLGLKDKFFMHMDPFIVGFSGLHD